MNVILGTATPIQLDAVELWDPLIAISPSAPHVLGTLSEGGEWSRQDSLQFLTGQRPQPTNNTNRWGLFRNPLPPAVDDYVVLKLAALKKSKSFIQGTLKELQTSGSLRLARCFDGFETSFVTTTRSSPIRP